MRIAIYRDDKDRLERRIAKLINEFNYETPRRHGKQIAKEIIELLEREQLWDEVIEV